MATYALNISQLLKLDILWAMLDAMTMAYQYQRAPYEDLVEKPTYHKGIF